MPTFFITSPSSVAVAGVSSEGLTTTVLPQASAGPTFQVMSSSGRFQGQITPTTPTGGRDAPPASDPHEVRIAVGDSQLILQIADPSKAEHPEVRQALKDVRHALAEIQVQLKDAKIPPGLIRIETSGNDTNTYC